MLARVNRSVVKVVQLQEDGSGNLAPVVLYKKSGKKKKVTGILRPLEKAIRRAAKAQAAMADKYVERHDRSNRKNRDGFVRDMVPNLLDAGNNGRKKLRLGRMAIGLG